MKHLNIKIFGQVQGVFFRRHVQKQALALGLTGLASNRPDGSVYIEAEGSGTSLAQLVKWCERGPDSARVEKVEVGEGEIKNLAGFRVE